ncbi:hypothetical protein ACFWM3_19315 [Gottfriedia sp. NPDC058432]|uniref:hypothetical protein n=1 Tax=Gottfriedia sp. NPDC058432 TaxID=3346497 RepID=UPI00366681F1
MAWLGEIYNGQYSESKKFPVINDVSGIKKGYEESLREIEVSTDDKKKQLWDSVKSVARGAIADNIPVLKQFL